MITAHDEPARAILNMAVDYLRMGATQLGNTLANQLVSECKAGDEAVKPAVAPEAKIPDKGE